MDKKKTVNCIRVDMSKEHDAGRFSPKSGDRIGITGNFNGWSANAIDLVDDEGDWIYSIPVSRLLKESDEPIDTLLFRFVRIKRVNESVDQNFNETIPLRSASVQQLIHESPIFVFGESRLKELSVEILFTVGMSNQQILGFFNPSDGDKVAVSGNFRRWDGQGVILKQKGRKPIYQDWVRIQLPEGQLLHYKYRIISNTEKLIPNHGWEDLEDRTEKIDGARMEMPYSEFNDLRRAARFVLNTEGWERQGRFQPLEGDVIQIRLRLDEEERWTNALMRVKKYFYETAFTVPLSIQKIEWQVMLNRSDSLTVFMPVDINISGTKIEYQAE